MTRRAARRPLAWLTLALKRICWKLNAAGALEYEPVVLAEMAACDSLDPAVRVDGDEGEPVPV